MCLKKEISKLNVQFLTQIWVAITLHSFVVVKLACNICIKYENNTLYHMNLAYHMYIQ